MIKEFAEVIGLLGTIISVTISWSVNQSILWAFVHGLLAWIYVIYYVIITH
jgi:hypothetical protein